MTGVEPRFGYVVCEEHSSMSPVEVAEQRASGETLFYLQDARTFIGNDMVLWRRGGGYTTDVSQAALLTRRRAIAQNECRPTDIPWPKDYIDGKTRPTVVVQYIDRAVIAEAGVVLAIPPKEPKEMPLNCTGCGRWLSDQARYSPFGCPNCGANNRP